MAPACMVITECRIILLLSWYLNQWWTLKIGMNFLAKLRHPSLVFLIGFQVTLAYLQELQISNWLNWSNSRPSMAFLMTHCLVASGRYDPSDGVTPQSSLPSLPFLPVFLNDILLDLTHLSVRLLQLPYSWNEIFCNTIQKRAVNQLCKVWK